MHWPLRVFEVGVGCVSETGCEAADADESKSQTGSEAEFVFEAVKRAVFWAFELMEAGVLMVLEGLGVEQSPQI